MVQSLQQILETTWSAVQASISVILVLLYGYASRRWGLVSEEGEHNASKVSVTLFLPCLLFSEVGPLASWANIKEYWIIIAYSLFFQICSWLVGLIGVKVLRMPQWILPCMIFNNATSLPLLLLSSLAKNGALNSLIREDSVGAILSRGRVYLLINALICNLTRFAFGPRLMQSHPVDVTHPWSYLESPHALFTKLKSVGVALSEDEPEDEEHREAISTARGSSLSSWVGSVWSKVSGFLNPPMIGGLLAIAVGIIPSSRAAFFSEGALLSPFTQSVANLGDLYTVLQMFVLGAHLQSKSGPRPQTLPLLFLFSFRFAVMPLLSIGTVYGVRKAFRNVVLQDPALDFTMAIAPVGPPALTLAALVEMSDTDAATDTAIAQTIVISYIVTPLISLSVTAAVSVVGTLYSN